MKAITIAFSTLVLVGCISSTLHSADQSQIETVYRSAGSLTIAGNASPHHGTPPSLLSRVHPVSGELSSDSGPRAQTPPPPLYGHQFALPPHAGQPYPHGWGYPPAGYQTPYAHYGYPSHQGAPVAQFSEPSTSPGAGADTKKLTPEIAGHLARTAISFEGVPGELLQALQLLQNSRRTAFEKFLELDATNMSHIKEALESYVPTDLEINSSSPSGRRKSLTGLLSSLSTKEQQAQQTLQAKLNEAAGNRKPFEALATAAGARYKRIEDVAQTGLLTLTQAIAPSPDKDKEPS